MTSSSSSPTSSSLFSLHTTVLYALLSAFTASHLGLVSLPFPRDTLAPAAQPTADPAPGSRFKVEDLPVSPLLEAAPPESTVAGAIPADIDVDFDPARHLDGSFLAHLPRAGRCPGVHGLESLGYHPDEVVGAYSGIGHSDVFRMLSDEGVRVLTSQLDALSDYTRSSERIERMLRGTVFRSRFMRGLILSDEVVEVMSRMFGLPLVPNTIPHHLGHVNYAPRQLGRPVDRWHTDNVPFDYVLFMADFSKIKGGSFEIFKGTKAEAEAFFQRGEQLPRDRVFEIRPPKPGYAVAIQGHWVVHRAAPLIEQGDRITFVNSYVPKDLSIYNKEATRPRILRAIDPEPVVAAEWTAHRAIRAKATIDKLLAEINYERSTEWCVERLGSIAHELKESVEALKNEREGKEDHYGSGEN